MKYSKPSLYRQTQSGDELACRECRESEKCGYQNREVEQHG